MKLAAFIVRPAVAAVFVTAGTLKAFAPYSFYEDIQDYQLVPRSAAAVLAFYLPWLEIIGGFGLLSTRLYHGARAVLFALIIVFTGAIALSWLRGIEIHCGCFGRTLVLDSYPFMILKNFGILALLGFTVWGERFRLVERVVVMPGASEAADAAC